MASFWKRQRPPVRVTLVTLVFAYVAVLATGIASRHAMVGDEVTHYYLLANQARQLPAPTVEARIPTADGVERRSYPHVFLWHYIGAFVWALSGGSFAAVQFYHSLFWLQLLAVAWLLIRFESGDNEWAAAVYVIALASLPAALLFSVVFYQDIPATAQVVTSFLFLRKRKLSWSLLFMCIGLSLKETVFVFLPPYLVCVFAFFWNRETHLKTWLRCLASAAAFLVLCGGTAALFHEMGCKYYPYVAVRKYVPTSLVGRYPGIFRPDRVTAADGRGVEKGGQSVRRRRPEIANSPGDLRSPVNLVVYGGLALWLVLAGGMAAAFIPWRHVEGRAPGQVSHWATAVGLCFVAGTAYHMRTAPDARFFLAGLPFVLLPAAQALSRLPRRKLWMPVLLAAALLQTGATLAKTFELRHVRAGVLDAIAYLKANPPEPNRVFMYPEGNYRLFPCQHDWYLGYRIKDFWKADNDQRIGMLHRFKLGAIVIKKYRIGKMDAGMNNLGIYPDSFAQDVENDKRFVRALDNEDVAIYLVPPAGAQ